MTNQRKYFISIEHKIFVWSQLPPPSPTPHHHDQGWTLDDDWMEHHQNMFGRDGAIRNSNPPDLFGVWSWGSWGLGLGFVICNQNFLVPNSISRSRRFVICIRTRIRFRITRFFYHIVSLSVIFGISRRRVSTKYKH